MAGFVPVAKSYHSTPQAVLLPLSEIEPPFRVSERPSDLRGFDHVRLLAVLAGIRAGTAMPPVHVPRRPHSENWPGPFQYRLIDGYHRYYSSVAAGFERLPAMILEGVLG